MKKPKGIVGAKQFPGIVAELRHAGVDLSGVTSFAELLFILAKHLQCRAIPSIKIKSTVTKACLTHYQRHRTLPVERLHAGLGKDKFPIHAAIARQSLPKPSAAPNSDSFLQSFEWRKLRYQALKRSDGRCCLCGRGKPHGVVLNVDHIKPRRTHPQLALSLDNLQVLCEDCNHGKGNWDSTDWR